MVCSWNRKASPLPATLDLKDSTSTVERGDTTPAAERAASTPSPSGVVNKIQTLTLRSKIPDMPKPSTAWPSGYFTKYENNYSVPSKSGDLFSPDDKTCDYLKEWFSVPPKVSQTITKAEVSKYYKRLEIYLHITQWVQQNHNKGRFSRSNESRGKIIINNTIKRINECRYVLAAPPPSSRYGWHKNDSSLWYNGRKIHTTVAGIDTSTLSSRKHIVTFVSMSKISEKNHQEPDSLFCIPDKHVPEELRAKITKTGRLNLKNIKHHIPAIIPLVEQILTNSKTLACLTNICVDYSNYELLYDGPNISFCYPGHNVDWAFVCNHLGYNSQIYTPNTYFNVVYIFCEILVKYFIDQSVLEKSNAPSLTTRTSL